MSKGGVRAIGRETCPCCGQTINTREEVLTRSLVYALFLVYRYCRETGRHEFQRSELDPVILKAGKTAYSKFGMWKWFSNGGVYSPEGHGSRGWWGFNVTRIEEMFRGKRPVASRVLVEGNKNLPQLQRITRLDPVKVWNIKGTNQLKDETGAFVVNYFDNDE